jgi:hypothetical protein
MTSARLVDLKDLNDVARMCGVERDFIEEYVHADCQRNFYTALKLPKRGRHRTNQFRVVFAAKQARLSAFHRSVSMIVTNSATFGDHVQGFLKKRSTRTNAKQHLGARVLLHADITGFFDAITTNQVKAALIAAGASVALATTLAQGCTIDGLLRQGTRCSPTLANLVCRKMDATMVDLATAHECVYTRYADDMTFSGSQVPEDDAIIQILESNGFELRDGRCYRQYKGRSQYVTGLTVSDSSRPRLPRRLKHRLRLIFHYIGKYGLDEHWNRLGVEDSIREEWWLCGMLKFARSIEPELVEQWQQVYDKALAERSLYS